MRRTALSPVSPKRLAQAKAEGRVLRSTLQATSELSRSTPIRQRNPERFLRRRADAFGPQAGLCTLLPCCACGRGPCDPHHDPTVASGGVDRDTVPLCLGIDRCHPLAHHLGMDRFQEAYAVSFLEVQARLRQVLATASEPELQFLRSRVYPRRKRGPVDQEVLDLWLLRYQEVAP